MTPKTVSQRILDVAAFETCSSSNFGDVIRDEGARWQSEKDRELIEKLSAVAEAARTLIPNDYIAMEGSFQFEVAKRLADLENFLKEREGSGL